MTTDTLPERGAGDNHPPDDLAISLAAVVEDASPWLTGSPIVDDAQAEKVAALVTRADAAMKSVKAAEEVEKRPHLDATKAIRQRYADDYADALKKAEAVVAAGKTLLSTWQRAKQAKRDEQAAALAAEAAEQAEAARAALQASGGDLDARLQAEAMAEAAKTTEIAAKVVSKLKVAPQVGGRSLRHRKVYEATVTNVDAAIEWAWLYDFNAVWRALRPIIERMACDAVRTADKPEGEHRLPGHEADGIVVTVRKEAF